MVSFTRHAALLIRGQLAVGDGTEPGRLDAPQVDALLHQEAAHGLHAPLTQREVVVQRAGRIRIALQLHGQPRILLHLAGQPDQRRLPGIAEVGLVEAEAHLDGLDEVARVTVVPEASESAVDLVGTGQGAVGSLTRSLGQIVGVADRGLERSHARAHALDGLTLLGDPGLDGADALSALTDPRVHLTDLCFDAADALIDLRLLLSHLLLHPAPGGTPRQHEKCRRQNHTTSKSLSHCRPPLCRHQGRSLAASQNACLRALRWRSSYRACDWLV